MSLIAHPGRRPTGSHDTAGPVSDWNDGPVAADRWQPTRAGAVNSWAWTDETLIFADGWLALAGPNGSGKSLTASMLVTVLLDGEVSQKALSVSGEAVGTLIDRHTDRNAKEDRTGAWWLEYGYRDCGTGEVRYLTTGLWLRSQSSGLQKAFFIMPGRVGTDLVLAQQREPVSIEGLAEQVAAVDGRLFTSHDRLTSKVRDYVNPAEENQYRDAIRTTLFAPLDSVQFDALVGVLRSLRSVRTAEAISPNQMRAVLTEALPALDPRALQFIADTMERIADLEAQLKQARAEIRQLEQSEQQYQRYIDAVIAEEAARLANAQTVFDDHAREARAAEQQLADAQAQAARVQARREELRGEIAGVRGRLQAAEDALRDHAGAELPHLEERLSDLRKQQSELEAAGLELQDESQRAAQQAAESADQARNSQRHMTGIGSRLRATAANVGAHAFVDRLAEVTEQVTAANSLNQDPPKADLAQIAETPRGWIETRTTTLNGIETALHEHDMAQIEQRTEAGHLRTAEETQDRAADRAGDASAERRTVEQDLLDELSRWDSRRAQLPSVPADLTTDAEDRIDPDRLVAWLHGAGTATRERIALGAREQDVVHGTRVVQAAEGAAHRAAQARKSAEQFADQAQRHLENAQAQAEIDRTAVDEQARQARADHDAAVDAAHAITATAEQALVDGRVDAIQAATEWGRQVAGWRARLVHLDGSTVNLPDDPVAIDLRQPFLDLERAHSAAVSGLQRAIAGTGRAVEDARQRVAGIEDELEQARRQLPVPQAPPWRSPRDPGRGVPLWAAVAFADHVSAEQADRIEGALLTAGLLDALITGDRLVGDGDLVLAGDRPAAGRSLADVLVAENGSGVDPRLVEWLLRAVAIDLTGSDLSIGYLRTGNVIASAPRDYRATFIGRTARESARLALVADLEQRLAAAHQDLQAEEQRVEQLEADVRASGRERDDFPPADAVAGARDQVTQLQLSVAKAQQQTTQALATAAAQLIELLAEVKAVRNAIDRTVENARRRLEEAAGTLKRSLQTESDAGDALISAQEELAEATERRNEARAAQQLCAAEEQRFPDVEQLRRTTRDEDAAERDAAAARALVDEHRRRHQQASDRVRTALRALHTAATLPDGAILPTDREALRRHREMVTTLLQQIEAWQSAGQRALDLLTTAQREQRTADWVTNRFQKAIAAADQVRLAAEELDARVEQTRALYGAEYAELRQAKDSLADELTDKLAEGERRESEFRTHDNAAVAATTTLEKIAPRRREADQHRADCFDRMCLLVTHGFAEVPETLARDSDNRPANLTAALTWSRQLLAGKPTTGARLDTLRIARERVQKQLESTMRSVNQALAEFDQQLDSTTLDGTEWRRITLAAPNAAVGEDLRQAAETLRATAEGLERDLRQDVKATLKTSMFTQLRRDIQTRREAARELVRQIRATLENVRTGVARVGVQVDWRVRDDGNSQQMVALLKASPSDEVFDQMYEILRERMEDAGEETWTDRVAHTFDYRSWHHWEISVTHSSFGTDQFKPVNARSNPLKGLSTGESRLATMLPLLAAAWSMYSGDTYRGPRLLSIDEIDAAFDDRNLRQILALLRTWNFDILATTPTIAPLIKREAQHVVVHEVITDGRHRVTVPWLWNGSGEPTPLPLAAPTAATTPDGH
ncbi:SbcC/MukB-like Walker B domain-containing protein [Plantactinospora soyae]|uniref:Chromosome segregation ATPase n=1 Tax=Plantactinospora soyae TaxID=1544732 RepID=A0A927R7Q9_9ACTN|nr:SbcC/MukB-like Walker B domain-containing protein [Plantactinospora soyae]MBE1489704.1 chromosome segregation ATPase [Plantactinospora soyae]